MKNDKYLKNIFLTITGVFGVIFGIFLTIYSLATDKPTFHTIIYILIAIIGLVALAILITENGDRT